MYMMNPAEINLMKCRKIYLIVWKIMCSSSLWMEITPELPPCAAGSKVPFLADHLISTLSHWPVVELAGGYAAWREASLRLLADLTADERTAILGGNAARVYQLDC